MVLLQSTGLVHGVDSTDIRDGVGLSVNLEPDEKQYGRMAGAQACRPIDIDAPNSQPVNEFWERVNSLSDLTAGGLVLNPDEFYILASREFVTVPRDRFR